ncbi:monovalent cation:H+ antiporter-2, CPA2 family [Meinhardsimonia xiamenensis]|uniref:Monovalent cation:H+ antiporter-2, CPA2 family n=1 Tax=Meinhardsimonia xiamenensis TaxID=990712 RepID=A0A1G9B5G1_9RHOB|nr:cation:proton antiporter [Meinhardsimonia xiamenensis]PRX35115.1 Kef-type potassium/proton antiporter (CPA2 family) [Meinhardsimonia xiamenensis]SDK34708.1 monovalent cation:H+ antiporter-2, CPA2 family [Meinhardsimonia xiamenensis]
MEAFLFQATIYLGAAVIAVPVAARLGLGSVLGYLAAGVIVGPVLGLVGEEAHDLRHFAEFGVVLMLFLIGLEMQPGVLWDMRHRLLGLGGLQIALTTAAVAAGAMALGQPLPAAVALGLSLAMSSTAIVLQTLSEKGLMKTSGGRSAFSVLLTQDIAVVPVLALMPLLSLGGTEPMLAPDGSIRRASELEKAAEGAHGALSLVDGLPGWGVTLVTLGAVGLVILAGVYLVQPLFRYIHATRLREMYTALALFLVIGTAFLMTLVGLSPALGTFLAGVVLANSEFRHELQSDIEPFKGLLLGLFFITVGAGMDLGLLADRPGRILGLAIGLVALKALVLLALAHLFKLKGRSRWIFTLGLAQAGEFGFVLIAFAAQLGILGQRMAQETLLVIALTMLSAPLMFLAMDWLARRQKDHAPREAPDENIDSEGEIIIVGIGRFGQVVNRMIEAAGMKATVLDNDLQKIQLMRRFGFKAYFGDPTRPEILQAAGLDKAKVLVIALDNPEAAVKIVRLARRARPDLFIIARARDRAHVFALHRAGADKIVREVFDSSLRAARYALESMGLSEFEAAELERTFYQHDRHALKELAELWVPEVPVDRNPAYVKRAQELDKALETALMARDKAPLKLESEGDEPARPPREEAPPPRPRGGLG